MPALVSIPSEVYLMIRSAALAKGLRAEAVVERLHSLGADLFSDAGAFAALFAVPVGSDDRRVPSVWEIGDAFWRRAGASTEKRKLDGSFYTPAPVIDRILDLAGMDVLLRGVNGEGTSRICDPALGCGFFFIRLLDKAKKILRNPAGLRKWADASLYGVDRDAGAVYMARVLLWLHLSDCRNEFLPDPARFRCADSLLGPAFEETQSAPAPENALDWGAVFPEVMASGGFDAVIGNPPYEVLTNFARRPERKDLADAIRSSGFYRDSIRGQVNLYRCFVERALGLLRPRGVLSFIVPLSLARDSAAACLRRRMLEEEGAADWLLFSERDNLFPGVTQAACVFKARRGGGAVDRLRVEAGGGVTRLRIGELRRYGSDLAIPSLDAPGAALWRWVWRNCPGRMVDIAEMRVGEVDQTFFRDCMADTDTGCLLARGGHLTAFYLDVEPEPGRERFLDLDRFLAKKGRGAAASRELAGVWRVAQLGIRNMQSRPRLVAALSPPGVYLGNSLNVYYPRDGVPLEYLAGLLNSAVLDWLFRLASGNNNINLSEMTALPIPITGGGRYMEAVISAYRRCADAARDGADTGDARIALDTAVTACYGIPKKLQSPLRRL